jgi:hypothetical protein
MLCEVQEHVQWCCRLILRSRGAMSSCAVAAVYVPDITSPNSFQIVPLNFSNCICLIGL